MITLFFDRNLQTFIASQGNPSPAQAVTWVYHDNYNLQIYVMANGIFQTLNPADQIALLLYQAGSLPDPNDAIIGSSSLLSDASGNNYYQINVNLFTSALQTLVQVGNAPAAFKLRAVFTPVNGERISTATDLAVTVVPDVTQGSTGATPASGTYPALSGNSAQVLNGAGAWVVPGFPASTFQFGQAIVTFPATTSGGLDTATTTVSAAWVTANSLPHVQITTGGDHNDLDDGAVEDLNAVCGNIVVGVSFDIEIDAIQGTTDRWAVNWFSTV